MPGAHDQLLKDLFAAFAADLLTLTMPRIAEQLQLDRLEFRPEEFYLDRPRGRQVRLDLVATAPLRRGSTTVVIHVENELRYRSRALPRLSRYNRILKTRFGEHVHTLVVYLKGATPGISRQTYQTLSQGEVVDTFHYTSFGLARARAETYLERREPLAWALAALMRPASRHGKPALRLACLRRIAAAQGLDDTRRFLLFNCVATYLQFDGRARQEYEALLAEHGNLEVKDMQMTWADQMIEVGRTEGRLEGRLAMLDLVLRQLRMRFDTLPQKLVDKISALRSTESLSRLGEQILAIESLDDLEIEDEP